MGRIVLVTGTDTGVGKTIVAAWLAWATPRSQRVALVKAVQTGADPSVDGDEAFYRAALAGHPITMTTLATFPEPLAPSIAARRAGKTIRARDLARSCIEISQDHDLTIVEGSGGLMVPIDEDTNFADFAGALGATLVLVIRPGLGTLNHTTLTLEAAARRNISIEMLVCNGLAAKPRTVEIENLRFFRDHYPEIPLISLRRLRRANLHRLSLLRPRLLGDPPPVIHGSMLERMELPPPGL
ncbi:MAG: dethiobiotin synthase [Chloroflexi bacterium]|nr:dethiobiotin synthase [Chloroflexota bacterium]